MNETRPPESTATVRRSTTWDRLSGAGTWAVAAVFAGLSVRQLQLVNTHAVNMMYSDQYDIYEPLFLGQGWWETFALQHGPHREGLGLVVTRMLAAASGWNSRWDAFAASVVMILAAALGLRLALRFGIPRTSVILAAVPLLFLNVHDYEIFVGAANLSYGSMPMVLFMAYCLSWFIGGVGLRLVAVVTLTFLLIFTGFGLFVGIVTPPLLAAEAVQAWRSRSRSRAVMAAAALAGTGLAWALFARGYTFQPAVAGFRFPYEHPPEYVVFVARMLGNFFGTAVLSAWQLVLGLAVALCLAAISAWNAVAVLSRGVAGNPRNVVLFCLSTFTLLFCANCAVGRVFTGPIAPLAPRYASLLIPGGLAILLQLWSMRPAYGAARLAVAYTALLIPATALHRPDEVYGENWYAEGRSSWKAAYLATHDEAKADQISHFSVYPVPLAGRLAFLEKNRLNLFLPRTGPDPNGDNRPAGP